MMFQDKSLITQEINAETLILAVEQHPELWDTSSLLYKEKNKKLEGWKEVCSVIIEGFDERTIEQQNTTGKAVVARWRSVRDAYVKSKRKGESLQKSEAGAKRCHPYLYGEHLTFLDRCLGLRQSDKPPTSAPIPAQSTGSHVRPSLPPTASTKFPKKRRNVPAPRPDMQFSSFLRKPTEKKATLPEEDEDMAFFKSILPTVKQMDASSKFDFRMRIMGYLQRTVIQSQSPEFPSTHFMSEAAGVAASRYSNQYEQSAGFRGENDASAIWGLSPVARTKVEREALSPNPSVCLSDVDSDIKEYF